ncbi:hypothetical protein MPSEU_000528800 [Mayamaea pseudoterrestris]|nr:hypothetical protein MPSEU_000528800 [Mayamaea pseudoterrestris]
MNIVCLLSSLISAVTAESILKQVHLVTRHGSRLTLRKGDNLKEFTEGPLTSLGQKQMYNLGVWIKERYNHKNTSFFFDTYQADKVRLESSSFERTVSSANSLALGLFNATARDPLQESQLPSNIQIAANVPVYSRDAKDDYIIRAYDKCPNGLQLDALYDGLQFQSLAQKHASLLKTLGAMRRFNAFTDETGGSIAVDLVWNVYDSIQVAKTECGASPNGSTCTAERHQLVHVLTPKQWNELQEIAKQAEFLKYGTKNAGRLIGGNLMLQILERMNDDDNAAPMTTTTSADGLDGFYLYSAHYPVLLGLLAALEEDPVNKESIPAYAAALVLELYVDAARPMNKRVRVVYRPGVSENGLDTDKIVVLDSICSIDNADETALCSLDSLNEYFANVTLKSWCHDCGSQADACTKYNISQAICHLATKNNSGQRITGVAGFFLGLVVAAAIGAIGVLLWSMRTKQKHLSAEPANKPAIMNENDGEALAVASLA